MSQNEIKKALALQNRRDKINELESIRDDFEYTDGLGEEDIVEGVKLLLDASLQENDGAVKESLFRTIERGVAYYDIGDRIDWDRLAALLPSLENVHLGYVLDTLGFSGQEKYLPTLEEYAQDSDSDIKASALNAIREVKYRVAHASAGDIQ